MPEPITQERIDELFSIWINETSDPETEEWREDLTEHEFRLVDSWDRVYYTGFYDLCNDILMISEQYN